MELLLTSFFWVTLAEIVMVNIMLSGDNAVVIALASRSLPPEQQRLAVLYGSLGAILLRIALTFFAVMLLDFPMLKIVGAVLLVWIGIKMLIPEVGGAKLDAHENLLSAIKTIIVADLVMSLDNVLGVAAAAKGNTVLLVIGLVISIPLIIYGSTLIIKLMERFGFIVTLGAGLLGWVAGEMLITDPAISSWTMENGSWAHSVAPVTGAMIVVLVGTWFAMTATKTEAVPVPAFVPQPEAPETSALVFEERSHHAPAMNKQAAATAAAEFVEPTVQEDHAAVIDDPPTQENLAGSATEDQAAPDAPPPGYRWVTRRWRTLPGGGRDYAALHGMETFRWLVPVSSRLRGPRHKRHG